MSVSKMTVIVTAHDETFVCGPAMKSADLSVEFARSKGAEVEKVLVLDDATQETKRYFAQPAFESWKHVELEEGDLGRVRNAIISQIDTDYVAFLDADDLFSENWLHKSFEILEHARRAREKVIVHPEMNWFFDGSNSVLVNPDLDDPLFDPYFFYFSNYYDSLCATPIEAHREIPYVSRDIPNGLSFQDWQFSLQTIAAGWKHVCARDTIIFKRKRDFSLVTESRKRKSIVRQLACMRIDNVQGLTAKALRET